MRNSLTKLLRRLHLLHPAISARDTTRRCWQGASDRIRLRRFRDLRGSQRVRGFVLRHRDGHHVVVARVRESPRHQDAVAANHTLAFELLASAGIAASEVDKGVLIVDADTRQVLDALARGRSTVYARVAGSQPVVAGSLRSIETDSSFPIDVCEYWTAPTGDAVHAWDAACRISDQAVSRCPREFTGPIDVVYTWVDGSDPDWLRRRSERLTGESDRHPEAASDARFRSYDELRYSLRSLEQFAGFVRHVFVVTDQQSPSWLRRRSNRLTIVDHRDIFPEPDMLPTFNSHSIEACLHRIDGLSEHYVYLNDDFFFGRAITCGDFFAPDGRARTFRSHAAAPNVPATDDVRPVDTAAINSRQLMRREYGIDVGLEKFKHAPYAQRRQVHAIIETRFAEDVDRTRRSVVRSFADLAVASSLHQHVAHAERLGEPSTIDGGYADLNGPHLAARLDRIALHPRPRVFCLNDAGAPSARRVRTIQQFLEALFPEPSEFER